MTTALASPLRRPSAGPHAAHAGGGGDRPRPTLRLVPPPDRATCWRRRVGALIVIALLALLMVAGVGHFSASASLEDRVAGHVVIEPGQTLWEVAAASAPEGMDVRSQLHAIQQLNGLDGGQVDAWSVVLLPAQ